MKMKAINRAIGAIVTLGLLTMILTACSAENRARRLVRKGYANLERAKELDPNVADSLTNIDSLTLTTPESSGDTTFTPLLDTSRFARDLHRYDSLLRVSIMQMNQLESHQRMTDNIMIHGLNKLDNSKFGEKQLRKTRELQEQIDALRAEFFKGYQVDTSYIYEDSLLTAEIYLKDGLIDSFAYILRPQKIDTTLFTQRIVLDDDNVSFYMLSWLRIKKYWPVVLLAFIALGFVIFTLRRARKK